MIRTNCFPKILKRSRILHIKKEGKSGIERDFYRPINNLSAVDKIIEEVMRRQLDNYFESNHLIAPNNHGGRKGHSTLTAHTMIQSINSTNMDNRRLSNCSRWQTQRFIV